MNLNVDSTRTPAELDLVVCPECAAPRVVEWREVVAESAGSIAPAKIRCLDRTGS